MSRGRAELSRVLATSLPSRRSRSMFFSTLFDTSLFSDHVPSVPSFLTSSLPNRRSRCMFFLTLFNPSKRILLDVFFITFTFQNYRLCLVSVAGWLAGWLGWLAGWLAAGRAAKLLPTRGAADFLLVLRAT